MVLVPSLRAEEVAILFEYVFAKERYRPHEFPALFKACRELGVPTDRLPQELLQYADDASPHVAGRVAAVWTCVKIPIFHSWDQR